MNALVAVRGVRAALNTGSLTWRNTFATQKGGAGAGAGPSQTTSAATAAASKNVDPPSNIFKKLDSKVIGPGASKESPNYKNPEYFSYHQMSFAEMEIVMAKHRIPQPSSVKK